MSHRITNQTRNSVLATQAEVANTFWSRGRGLMGRAMLPEGGGLILYPTSNIHMFFMRFAIDVVFVNRNFEVVGVRERFPPWHPFAGSLQARYTLELPVGMIAASQTQLGDVLAFEPVLP